MIVFYLYLRLVWFAAFGGLVLFVGFGGLLCCRVGWGLDLVFPDFMIFDWGLMF